MTTAFADEAIRVREVGHLSDTLIAEATGATPSTVQDWLNRRSSPTGTCAQRVAELAEIVDRAGRVMRPEYIPVWMLKPLESLDDFTPLDLLADGQARRVAHLITQLEYPGVS